MVVADRRRLNQLPQSTFAGGRTFGLSAMLGNAMDEEIHSAWQQLALSIFSYSLGTKFGWPFKERFIMALTEK